MIEIFKSNLYRVILPLFFMVSSICGTILPLQANDSISCTEEKFFLAANDGNIVYLTKCLNDGIYIDTRNEDGNTALMISIASKKENAFQFLFSKGATIDVVNSSGDTPLHYAAYASSVSMAKFLIDKGLDVNALDKYNDTPLHSAVFAKSLSVSKLLIEKGADINVKNYNGETPLINAIGSNALAILKYFYEIGANFNFRNEYGETLLHYAAKFNALVSTKFLIEKGLNVKAVDNYLSTPLHEACLLMGGGEEYEAYASSYDVAELLLKNGADVNAKNKYGNKAINFVSRGNIYHNKMVELFKRYGLVEE